MNASFKRLSILALIAILIVDLALPQFAEASSALTGASASPCTRINLEVGRDAKTGSLAGRYVIDEVVTGRRLADWSAINGQTDSGWVNTQPLAFGNAWVTVAWIPAGGGRSVPMTIVNPAGGTDYGWISRQGCAALEVEYPRTDESLYISVNPKNVTEAVLAMRKIFGKDARSTARLLKAAGYTGVETAAGLKLAAGYNIQDSTEAAQILKDASFGSVEVASALKQVFSMDAPQSAALVLKAVGFSAIEIASALKDPNLYNVQDSALAAQMLKDISFGSVAIATALKQIFSISDAASVAAILTRVGFSATEVAGVLKVLDLGDSTEAARILKDASLGPIEIAAVLKQAYSIENPALAALILKNVGFSAVEIAGALRDPNLYDIQDGLEAAQILKKVDFSVIEVANVLKNANLYNIQDSTHAAQILKNASFDVIEVDSALDQVFSAGVSIYAILKNVGFSAVAVAIDLRVNHGYKDHVFIGYGVVDVARILKDASFGPVEVASALRQIFSVDTAFSLDSTRSAVDVLYEARFNITEIAQALKDPSGYNLEAPAAAKALSQLKQTYEKGLGLIHILVAHALYQVYGADDAHAAQNLKDAGFNSISIAEVLKDETLYNVQDAAIAKGVLKNISFSTTDVAYALGKVYRSYSRPFYIVAHNPNALNEVDTALAAGANALEPDVMRFSDKAEYYVGQHLNDYAGPSGLFMYHDNVLVTSRMPATVEAYLDHVHNLVKSGSNVALIVFDIKSPAATPDFGAKLLLAVRTHLNTDGVWVPVIYSVASTDDGGVFENIIPHITNLTKEGVMIDGDKDPIKIYNYFVQKFQDAINNQDALYKQDPLKSSGLCSTCDTHIEAHIGYGNGSAGEGSGLWPNVLLSIEKASWMRAARGAELAIPYAYPIDGSVRMKEYINAGVDGLIPDADVQPQYWPATLLEIKWLKEIVLGRSDIYLATSVDNPFPFSKVFAQYALPTAAYGLKVNTLDKNGAGTDSKLTFTLKGSQGEASVTIDASYQKRMESGDVNYVTIQSKSLGTLQCLTLQSDGAGAGSAWNPGSIEISSARWMTQTLTADFTGTTVDKNSPQIKALGGTCP